MIERNEHWEFYDNLYRERVSSFEKNRVLKPHKLVTEAVPLVNTRKTLVRRRKNALELGSGFGDNTLYLAKHGFNVTAVDFSQPGIKEMERCASLMGLSKKVRGVHMDVCHALLEDNNHIVVSTFLLDHFEDEKAEWVVHRMQEKTAVGGLNVIVTFAHGTEFELMPDTLVQKTIRDLMNLPEPEYEERCLFREERLRKIYSSWDIVTCYQKQEQVMGLEKPHPILHLIARKLKKSK